MVKNLPIIMASNAERIGRKIESCKLIKRGLLITPLLIGNVYAGENAIYSFDLPAQPLSVRHAGQCGPIRTHQADLFRRNG